MCPCGSKKKHKACCGVVVPKSHKLSVGSKDIKDRFRKTRLSSTSLDSEIKAKDVGSLCI